VNVDFVPLVVIKTDPGRSDLDVQLPASQINVERHGAIAERQSKVILAVAFIFFYIKT